MDLKGILKFYRMNESVISVVLGAVVVVLIGWAALRWFGNLQKAPGAVSEQAASQTQTQPTPSASPSGIVEQTASGENVYQVALGDSLWKISQRFFQGSGYNWVDIASANKLTNPGLIFAGQKLVIPNVPVKIVKTTVAQQTTGLSITESSYKVVRGDSLWKIAVAAYGDGYSWTKIYQANEVAIGANPGKIAIGMTLTIPR